MQLHSICMQLYLVVIFQTSIDAENYSAFNNLCRIIWMLRRMKKGNSIQPTVSIHQDHLDNVAQHKPKII